MKVSRWENEYRSTTVHIESYDNGELVGRFSNPHREKDTAFYSLTQFLKEMESLLDDMNFPQSFTANRTFAPPLQPRDSGHRENSHAKNCLASFAVKVIFRQHSSWQGSVIWLGQGKEQSFRSVLELILLMDSALCEAQMAKAG